MSNTFTLQTADGKSQCVIGSEGCRILDLVLRDKKILWSGNRPDDGFGATHLCVPNFREAQGLPQHGPARKEQWHLVEPGVFSWEMTAVEGIYPAGIRATRKHLLTETSLVITTVIENAGPEDLRVNIADHPYFACHPDKIDKIMIDDFEFGKEAADDTTQYIPAQRMNRIVIPDQHTLMLELEGYHHFALWSLKGAQFACIEPLEMLPPDPEKFFENAAVLRAGEERRYSYTITLQL